MSICDSDLLTHGKESSKYGRRLMINSRMWTLPMIRFSVKYWMLLIALNDHVVHDHICIHDLPHLIFDSGKSGVPNNSKLSPKHTKCKVDIFLHAS
jgi:hypothetical protein